MWGARVVSAKIKIGRRNKNIGTFNEIKGEWIITTRHLWDDDWKTVKTKRWEEVFELEGHSNS